VNTIIGCQDHPEIVQKVTKLLVKLVKHNPDLAESSWQYRTASIVPVMMMIGSGSVFIIIITIIMIIIIVVVVVTNIILLPLRVS